LQRGEREGISYAELGYSYASHILKAVLLQEEKCPFSIPEYAFILQKNVFWVAKDHLLQCKTSSFAIQKICF